MSRPIGPHGGYNELRGRRTSRMMQGSVLALLAISSVLTIMVLKVPTATTGDIPCDCEICHGDFHGANWTGCTACHESPPASGSHQVHYNSSPQNNLRYGDTTVQSTAQAYLFGCGNCHPLDKSKHRNGSLDVELYDSLAPPSSLKAKNPSNATYDPALRTCSNVYCHSGTSVTSGPVGLPLTSPPNPVPAGYTLNNSYIMDQSCSNLTYDPYDVTVARDYKTTPAWGTTGTFMSCTECHPFPLTTFYPEVSAGVGDSHQWVDSNNWNWGHAYNMAYGGIPCATCHYTSVDHFGGTGPPTYWTVVNGADVQAYYPVAVKDRSLHVNGAPDVAFDTLNGYRYVASRYTHQYDLTSATYNAQTKTCTNVTCHSGGPVGQAPNKWQQNVKWGTPYRGEGGPVGTEVECDVCHRYGYLSQTCQ